MLKLNYGKAEVAFDLPPGKLLGKLEGKTMPAVKNAAQSIIASFSSPIDSPPLKDFIKAGDTVAICVPDKTRHTKTDVILPLLLDELNKFGVPDENITVIFSRGTHLSHTRAEQEKIVGNAAAKRVKLLDHDSENKNNLVKIGKTSRGNEIFMNKIAVEADKRIFIGGITYHYFAGFAGGRKTALPGISSYETIQNNHKFVLAEIKEHGQRKYAVTGNLINNPVHEDMLEAAKLLVPTFIINVVLNQDKELSFVFSGDIEKAHLSGCETIDRYARVAVKEKADLVIVSAGGHPKDIDFVQAHKAMENASYVLKPGGVLIVVAESEMGYPRPEYLAWAEIGSAEAIAKDLKRQFLISKHTVYAAVKKAETFKVIWLTKMDHSQVKKMQIIPVSNMQDALAEAVRHLPPNPLIYVIPQGYNTLPSVK
ncbi:MAG: nickel-dependent lactate racemase [Candidatus Margulisbacteria bacterium]|nr:nickel-dependent lactate racemase [Candidatus Margulisiibacteriota bacterium]MBU1021275.1 nickel-dependent lactate racemase [Candidatus Margulisiibacteriota bacterium]MBU1729236.1 nickel-dependent lactate racemase [Candidatus Margulisiibacteriota bacterium]MBU1954909.1 nickel-dependent lactate racemase [Candidatus Margulisiibacteriota bacterium]